MIELAFTAALVVLAYTYVGYPALIWALAKLFPRPVRRAAHEPSVALVIVVHNEAARIEAKLDSCLAQDYPHGKLRILVVSDGSTDATPAAVAAYAERGVALLAFTERRGKAACVCDAVLGRDEKVVMLTDARQRLDARAVRELVENFADPEVGAVSGELHFETEGITAFGEGMDAYWRYEKFIRAQESRLHSTVGVTGALYAIRRECFRAIPADTILDDVLIPMNVVMAGRRVVFDGRAVAFDRPSRDAQAERTRKVRTIAGNYQLLAAYPRLLIPGANPVWFQLVSHKVLRLVSPLLLMVALAANAALAPGSPFWQVLLALQLAGYALAAAALVPGARQWKPVRIASAFVALNWFAVLGAIEFLRNPRTHLWDSGRPAGDAR